MKKTFFFTLILLIGCKQNSNVVESSNKKNILKASFKTEIHSALRNNKNSEQDLFLIAKLYTKNNQKDSAIFYINTIINNDSLMNIFNEPDFYFLIHEPTWKSIKNKQLLKSIKLRGAVHKDTAVVKKLWEMFICDQAYYTDIHYYDSLYGQQNLISDSLWEIKKQINKVNQNNLIIILNQIKWPKLSDYGSIASDAAFLVIQHSTTELQKKYLPIIEACCKEKEADWQNYCLMLDRILMHEGKPQVYGSQLRSNPATNKYELYPIENPKEVDKRRKEKGLEPLNDYLKNWGITYYLPLNN